jgi:Na+-translocating ferredoxin:NAD+ oxidoreductase RNF subunit RnfB
LVDQNSLSAKLKEIIALLPRKNCGKCGFVNCASFGQALVESRAQPFGCRQDPNNGYAICRILGIQEPEAMPNVGKSHGPHGNPASPARHHGHGKGHDQGLGRHGHHHV